MKRFRAAATLLATIVAGVGLAQNNRDRLALAKPATAIDRVPLAVRQVWADPETNTLGGPSPDGRYLSFVDVDTGDLALRDLATGEKLRLTRNRAHGEFAYFSTISPDGRQVAYAWFNDQKFYDLRVVATKGTEPRVLFRNEEAGFVQPCAWSPDGKQILTLFFRKDNISQIALVSAAEGSVRVLKSLNWVYPKKMDFSPDGRHIVYDNLTGDASSTRDIFVLSADGTRETRLVEHPANDLFPVWTPDGQKVLFASDRMGTMDAWMIRVADGKPEGAPELVKRDLGRFLPMGFTRKGAYYYGLRTGTTDVYIAMLDPATGKPLRRPEPASRRFMGVNSSPEWSPDGQQLAYFSRRGSENYGQEARVIVIRSLKTGEERELSPRLGHVERFRWSPDGLSFLAGGSDRRTRGGLFRVDAQTARFDPIVQDDSATFRGLEGIWSAAGDAIYYVRDGIRLRDLATGQEKELYRPASSAELGNLALSADGRALAFTQAGAVLVMPAAGGQPREVLRDGASGVEWMRDGSGLLITREGKLWQVPAGGGEPLEVELPGQIDGGISLHPDGRRIAFTAGKTRNEVWVMEMAAHERE